ncbi:HD domain-containing protein [uncultured Clostridium sp.]|uniref:HD domain-containing protein n=1 Tax=uncultured Clostridium sp. TaxID=59620 RepID=UPI0025D1E5BB|nr:HD domain-containing protein [uncultured Clostridium sp.]
MNISEIMVKMIEYSNGNLHDINHLIKVHTFARTICQCESISKETEKIIEIAAIVHDIACPLCREKYGNTNGKYQEKEGMILTKEFLKDTGLSSSEIERIVYLVGHHHTLSDIDGMDYQILIEADYLVNADESNYSKSNIKNMMEKYFKTSTGISLLKSMYNV